MTSGNSAEGGASNGTRSTAALFERDGSRVVPTDHARGPWRPDMLHGGAVAALPASAVDQPGWTPARLTVDLLAPVPTAPLTLSAPPPEGGRRVRRQVITLLAEDAPVARAHCLLVRRTELDLPDGATDHPNPFAGVPVPDLSSRMRAARDAVGYECFDGSAPAWSGLWVDLLLPDLLFEEWSFVKRSSA